MRTLPTLMLLLLTTALSAQTGRHFHRPTRTPTTPPASHVVEASGAAAVVPLRKLRSGRPWPAHHFGRLPSDHASRASAQPVDASHGRSGRARGFWRPRH